jgi:LTXXQ motif family protein
MKRNLVALLTCFVLNTYLICDAQAQWGGGGMGGRRSGAGQGRGSADSRQEADKPIKVSNSSDQLQMRFDELHVELQLTPVQEQLWTQFADKFSRYLDSLIKEKTTYTPFDPNLSGSNYVSQIVDASRNKYTLLEELEEKTKSLYSSLSRMQKLQFDTRIQSIVVKEIGR